jgi:ABC-type glycerol-3-phosphate transport system substrate-binding protein
LTHELSTSDGIWYNVNLLESAGLTPEDALATWDSYVEASESLTGDEKFAMALRGFDATGTMTAMWPFLMQKAGPLVSEDDIRSNLCSPGAIDVFERYVALYTEHGVTPNPVDVDFTTQLQMFSSERTAFLHQGSWMTSMVEEENPDMAGRFLPHPLPLFEDGERHVMVAGMSLMIGRGSEHPEAAWDFMKFLTSREKQQENLETTGFMPSNAELVNSPLVQDDPVFSVYASQVAEFGVPGPRSVHASEIWTAIHTEFHNALLGSKEPAAALEDACAAVDGILG